MLQETKSTYAIIGLSVILTLAMVIILAIAGVNLKQQRDSIVNSALDTMAENEYHVDEYNSAVEESKENISIITQIERELK